MVDFDRGKGTGKGRGEECSRGSMVWGSHGRRRGSREAYPILPNHESLPVSQPTATGRGLGVVGR